MRRADRRPCVVPRCAAGCWAKRAGRGGGDALASLGDGRPGCRRPRRSPLSDGAPHTTGPRE
eukprot:362860-Chlamydomonas_euryale.AAC.4